MVARSFFHLLMQNQCNQCWKIFSKKSQDVFLKWTLKDIYSKNKQAAEYAQLGTSEVRLLFENNDSSLMKSFWRRFFFVSGSNEFFRFGYFNTAKTEGGKAVVEILCKFPDGRIKKSQILMIQKGKEWKFGYIESGLPF